MGDGAAARKAALQAERHRQWFQQLLEESNGKLSGETKVQKLLRDEVFDLENKIKALTAAQEEMLVTLSVLDEMMRATPRQNVPFSRVMMPVAETYLQLAGDANVAPNAAALKEEDRAHAWTMAQEVVDQFFQDANDHFGDKNRVEKV